MSPPQTVHKQAGPTTMFSVASVCICMCACYNLQQHRSEACDPGGSFELVNESGGWRRWYSMAQMLD